IPVLSGIALDAQGTLWVSGGAGVQKWTGSAFQTLPTRPSTPFLTGYLSFDTIGNLYIVSGDSHVYKTNRLFTSAIAAQYLQDSGFGGPVAVDPEGDLFDPVTFG